MSTLTAIAYTIAALALGLGSFLFVRWIIGDRAKGRRRCPFCWYDLAGVAQEGCPECGRGLAGRRLDRTRRGWRRLSLALALLLLGGSLIHWRGVYNNGWSGAPTAALVEAFRIEPGSRSITGAHTEFLVRLRQSRVTRATGGVVVGRVIEHARRAEDRDARLAALGLLQSIGSSIAYAYSPDERLAPEHAFHFGDLLSERHREQLHVLAGDPDADVSDQVWSILADASRSETHAEFIPALLRHVADDFHERLDLLAKAGGTEHLSRSDYDKPFSLRFPDAYTWRRGRAGFGTAAVPMSFDVESRVIPLMRTLADAQEQGGEGAFEGVLERASAAVPPHSADADRAVVRLGFWLRVRLRHGTPEGEAFIIGRAEDALELEQEAIRTSRSASRLFNSTGGAAEIDLAVSALAYLPHDARAIELLGEAIEGGSYRSGGAALQACRFIPPEHLRDLRAVLTDAAVDGFGPENGSKRMFWRSDAVDAALAAGTSPESMLERILANDLVASDPSRFNLIVQQLDLRNDEAARHVLDLYHAKLEELMREPAPRRAFQSTPSAPRMTAFDRLASEASNLLCAYAVLSGETAFVTREVLDNLMTAAPSVETITQGGIRGLSMLAYGDPRAPFTRVSMSQHLDRDALLEAASRHESDVSRFWALLGLFLIHEPKISEAEAQPFVDDADPRIAELARLIVAAIKQRP